jgi:hypothetical protein
MVVLAPWNLMKLNRFGFSFELINLNNDCVKTIFVSLYLFVRIQTSLDHLVLSSEARRYLTIVMDDAQNQAFSKQYNFVQFTFDR